MVANNEKLKVGTKTFTYDLPCRRCNYQLPLNVRSLHDVFRIDGQWRAILICPNCQIANNVSLDTWQSYREKWQELNRS